MILGFSCVFFLFKLIPNFGNLFVNMDLEILLEVILGILFFLTKVNFWPPNFKIFHFNPLTLFNYQIVPSVHLLEASIKCLDVQLTCHLMWLYLTRHKKKKKKKYIKER